MILFQLHIRKTHFNCHNFLTWYVYHPYNSTMISPTYFLNFFEILCCEEIALKKNMKLILQFTTNIVIIKKSNLL